MKENKKKMNLPNKLTILRVLLVPVFVACVLYITNIYVRGLVSAAVFIITATTDFIDGKIARKYKLVTNFGKFMDPLADKFMIFASLLSITVTIDAEDVIFKSVMVWVSAIVFFRELAVTSIRLVCSGAGAGVIAASFFGKCKTLSQCVCICALLIEPVLFKLIGVTDYHIISYVTIAVMTFMTVASGIDYYKTYSKYLDPNE
ncbi:MAG: CDP-diacylglycerol--glycerol-3-phosphate 3-phosphatidyltransferase [Clostridia bacterium]|nr:CDP-diacylglycerol--glycerol-3-phosphate 3-phosphatidyltransferase [Clostridia bacterium]